jgi:hypothetical protein
MKLYWDIFEQSVKLLTSFIKDGLSRVRKVAKYPDKQAFEETRR